MQNNRNHFQQIAERGIRDPQQKSKIPVLHFRARRRAREEQEQQSTQQAAANASTPTNVESEPAASPITPSSSLNPNAQEFVFEPQFQFSDSNLNASAPEFTMPQQTTTPSIVMFPIPIRNPQPPVMMMMPMTMHHPSFHVEIPSVSHHHYFYHDVEEHSGQEQQQQQREGELSPPTTDSPIATSGGSSQSSTPEHTPAPKLATIEEESELDWEEQRPVFFADQDDAKEEDDDVVVCRDDWSGKISDGVVRKYCLDELISFRSFSICQSMPSGETVLTESILSRVSCCNRSAIDAALAAMNKPLLLLLEQQRRAQPPKRIVGKNNLNGQWNNKRSKFGTHHVRRNPPPRRPVKLSDVSRRRPRVQPTELEALMKKCRSILNKITPEKNYERLTSRLFELVEAHVKCYDHLEVVVSAIVEVGMMQSAFVERYVRLLIDMAKKTEDLVKSWDWIAECSEEIDSDRIVKILVRDCCRKNHELYWHTCNLSRQEEFLHSFITRESGCFEEYPQELATMIVDFCMDEEATLKMKRKFFGSEVLLAELCKQKMMPEKLICRGVINPLLRVFPANKDQRTGNEDEDWRGPVCGEELEAVCKLLQVVGFELDAKAPKWMDTYFGVIESLSSGLESRIKFMVMDLRDLRAANWGRPRVVESKKLKRRAHYEDVSKGYKGNAFVSSHDHGSYRRHNRGRNSYAYRTPMKYARRDS